MSGREERRLQFAVSEEMQQLVDDAMAGQFEEIDRGDVQGMVEAAAKKIVGMVREAQSPSEVPEPMTEWPDQHAGMKPDEKPDIRQELTTIGGMVADDYDHEDIISYIHEVQRRLS